MATDLGQSHDHENPGDPVRGGLGFGHTRTAPAPGIDWAAWPGLCSADQPPTCQGPTTWPPPTAWQRYAEDRRLGQRVPPSVSTWRPQDVRRQQEADALARGQAPQRPAVVLPWGPGPSCEGRDR